MLRKEIRHHERALEETRQVLEQQHGENENHHRSCVKKLSQIIDIIHDIKSEPISQARQLYYASPLSSPVSSSSQRQGNSFPSRRREWEINSAATIRSNVSNRRPHSETPRSRHSRPTGDFRRSVTGRTSFTSRPESQNSNGASKSRALVLRSPRNDQEHNRHSSDANRYEASENMLEIQPNALVLRGGDRSQNRRMSTRPTSVEEISQGYTVYHEYEDGSREIYNLSHAPSYARTSESGSESAASSENLFSSKIYVAMPPFDNTDREKLRRRQTRKRKGQDREE